MAKIKNDLVAEIMRGGNTATVECDKERKFRWRVPRNRCGQDSMAMAFFALDVDNNVLVFCFNDFVHHIKARYVSIMWVHFQLLDGSKRF